MIDIEKLEALAKAANSGLPSDSIQFALAAMDRDTILALIAEVRALRADAARFRWLNSQRENVWHEFASIPMNRTCEVIDQEIAKEKA